MSGGSFNYLCTKDASDLLRTGMEDAEHMVNELASLGYAQDAAQETAAVIAEIRAAEARLDAKIRRLQPVWRAMEWWRSADTSEPDLRAALAEYRGVELPTCKRCEGTGREPNMERPIGCQNRDCSHGKDTEQVR